jgi:hypothetical protein
MKKRIVGITAAFLIMVCCFVIGVYPMIPPKGVIVRFSFSDVKDSIYFPAKVNGGLVDEQPPYYRLPAIDRNTKNSTYHDGNCILVVKVGKSKNVLRSWIYKEAFVYPGNAEHFNTNPVELEPGKEYPLESLNLYNGAHVETEVQILKVLFESGTRNFKAGMTVKISEGYYLLDERISNISTYFDVPNDTEKSKLVFCSSGSYPTYPMEEGEIYVIHASYGAPKDDSDEEKKRYEFKMGKDALVPQSIVCLSDREKLAGYGQTIDILSKSILYLKGKYDIEKYLK